MKNKKILVLEGGFNEEHKISLSTGNEVKKSLSNLNIQFDSLYVNPVEFSKDIVKYGTEYICFNALHGTFGEDGQIQNILDKLFFKYTHSTSKSSFIGFNKQLTKIQLKGTNIATPDYIVIDFKKIDEDILLNCFLKFGKFIIKPISSGSSFGIKIFKNKKDIEYFMNDFKTNLDFYRMHNQLMIEKYIEGRELTVAVIEKNKQSVPVEVTEIIPNNNFFDYESKYTPGISTKILPAKIPEDIYNNCKNFAKIVHDKINCKGISRSDFIYHADKLYFLEINTQPGLTPISLVPQQLKHHNMFFDELILNIINCSL